jgi:hypothetical protein
MQDRVDPKDVVLLPGLSAPTGFSNLVTDEDAFAPMNSFIDISLLSMRRIKTGQLQMRVNAGIATPCGAWVWLDYTPLLNSLSWASERWGISGVTKDSTGAALGACRVIARESGRMELDGAESEVGETVSDGSGNYSIEVPLNTAYQLTGYKAGAPDVAGITRADVTPSQIG